LRPRGGCAPTGRRRLFPGDGFGGVISLMGGMIY
jgi:hypothetical protein